MTSLPKIEDPPNTTFTANYFKSIGDIYHQEDGAPQGLHSSGPCSYIVMDFWFQELQILKIADTTAGPDQQSPV